MRLTPENLLTTNILLTKEQTAIALNVTEATVYNLHRDRKLRGVMVGQNLLWRPADIRKYVDELDNGEAAA